jgi:hypothetical protein
VNVVVGPFTIAAALLAIGGAFKAASPRDTANALRGVGLPGSPWVVRAGGVIEGAIGAFAIFSGGRVAAALVAASYLAFAAFVAAALARGKPIATCGCFGKADTPPSLVHVSFNVAAAAVAVALLIDPVGGITRTVSHQPLLGIPYLMLVATGVYLSFLALTLLPRTLALVREARSA